MKTTTRRRARRLGVQNHWQAPSMPLAHSILLAIARALVAVLCDLVDGIGALAQNIGKIALALAIGGTPFYLIWLAGRSALHQNTPAIFWQAIPITWLVCSLVWQIGWLVRLIAHPAQLRRQQPPARSAPVTAQRIREWDAAWRRAIAHQQHAGHDPHVDDEHASRGDQHAGGHHERPGRQPTPSWAYHTLGLRTGATPDQIHAAYRELAKRLHPDRNPGFTHQAAERFRDIQIAYDVLSHPQRQAEQDQHAS